MKIAIVTHKLIENTGQGRVNYEVTKAAVRAGHQVTVLASEVAPDLCAMDLVSWVQVPVDGLPTELLRNQLFAWRSRQWLSKHRDGIDLTVANGCITWAPAEVNLVHFVHSAWKKSPVHTARVRRGPYAWYQWLYTALNARWEQQAFRKAKRVVAVSEQVREELLEIGLPGRSTQVIPNGVDLNEFKPGPADRGAMNLPGGVPLALFVGDIQTPRKNLDTVLEALVELPDLHLAVAGSTERSPYPRMAEELGVGARVHFLGFRRDMADLMRTADVFVFPSRYEPFALVVLEAMATGVPVVTARTVGAAQLLTEACGVVLSDPDDAARLAESIRPLLRDPQMAVRMGGQARAVAEQYSWKKMAQQYVDLFDEVEASKRAQASAT